MNPPNSNYPAFSPYLTVRLRCHRTHPPDQPCRRNNQPRRIADPRQPHHDLRGKPTMGNQIPTRLVSNTRRLLPDRPKRRHRLRTRHRRRCHHTHAPLRSLLRLPQRIRPRPLRPPMDASTRNRKTLSLRTPIPLEHHDGRMRHFGIPMIAISKNPHHPIPP